MRDDFDEKTKDILARRVGWQCSNPKCRKQTSGPQTDPEKTISIGVAAHITAASIGGPRFDATLSQAQRKSLSNGIWLCQACSRLIDTDEQRYSVKILQEWKTQSENQALRELEGRVPQPTRDDEVDPLETLLALLDEPDNWIKVEGDRYIRHRHKPQFIIKEGKIVNEDYQEPWVKKFPDPEAWSYEIEYWYGTILLRRSMFVVADGGRFTIPVPSLYNRDTTSFDWGNIEFSIDTSSLEFKTAMLFDQYESLWTTLPRVGVKLA